MEAKITEGNPQVRIAEALEGIEGILRDGCVDVRTTKRSDYE